MGREVKRVPLDFKWPMNQPWEGYLNPYYEQCKTCGGYGSTLAMQRLSDLVSLLLLSGSDAATGKCHPYFYDAPLYRTQRVTCGPDMTELTAALSGRAPRGAMGHDAIDQWSATRKITRAAGLPDTWGVCQDCSGHGVDKNKLEAYEAWQRSEPPLGDGYQIWETVSEGSPISPVFKTPEELARYMAGTRWGADTGTSYETWLNFITGPGWAPSLVIDRKGIRLGVEAESHKGE